MPVPQNVHVFTGENAFMLEEALQTWTRAFAQKHGLDNLVRLDAKETALHDLLDYIGVAPFLAAKRLVILRGQPKFAKEDIETLFLTIHPDVILLLVEAKFDQRLGAVKELFKRAQVDTFEPLVRPMLLKWMTGYAQAYGCALAPDAAERMLQIVGEEQDMLAAELRKLCLYASGRSVKRADVELLVLPGEGSQWTLTDLISERKVGAALLYAHDLSNRGQDAFAVWNIFLWFLRTLASVSACAQSGMTNPNDVAKSASVPWRRVQPLLTLQRALGPAKLKRIVEEAVAADIALKTGGYKATTDDTEELQSVIDRMILRFS